MVAGGSPAAAWKAELLSAAGARVDVYASDVSDDMLRLASDPPCGRIAAASRVPGRRMTLPARRSPSAPSTTTKSAAAFRRCRAPHGVPVNVIDRPAFCDFSFGAIVNRSPLVIGISTDGAAPVFAQAIRAKARGLLPTGFAQWAAAAARWRAR